MASSSCNDTLILFNTLPSYLQRRIDRAFDSAVPHPALAGGGFIIDDDAPPTQIPMSVVPLALQHLDLPPDDEQVLSVFRNAASGWSSSSSEQADGGGGGGMVSRDDWRAVCAVLLEHFKEEYEDVSEGGEGEDEDEEEEEGDSDQYRESEPDNDDDSDDDYVQDPGPSTSRRRTRGHPAAESVSPPPPSSKKLTPRQRQATLDAFALFFPGVPPDDLASQKIMIKDIQRVAKLLGEKIKADEMVDMLDAFSTAPDKSVGLHDFARIMVKANLA